METTEINLEVQNLRAFAIILTLFHHIILYLFPNPQTNSLIYTLYSNFTFWCGVDLFFCISGFVIMTSFLKFVAYAKSKQLAVSKIIISFWTRRLVRLMPAAIFWMIIYLLLTRFYNYLGAFGRLDQNIQDMMAAIFQYANLYGIDCWGANSKMICGPNGIYWSLSLEEQFYFVFPILFVLFRKKLAYLLGVLFLFQFFQNRPEWSFGWAFRFDAIVLGLLLGLFCRTRMFKRIQPTFLANRKHISLLIVISSIVLMAYVSARQNMILFNVGFLSLICGFLVWLASYESNYINFESKFFKNIFLWFGSRSYSLYLIHIIVFRLSYELLYQFSDIGYRIIASLFPILLLISIPLLFLLTEFSYKYIEVPSKKLANIISSNLF